MNHFARFAALPRGDVKALISAWAETEPRAFGVRATGDGSIELAILDVIGEDYWSGGGITSKAVKSALDSQKNAKKIRVLINSPGGDVAEGMAIYNLLRSHGAEVTTEVIGIAASAASWIVQAGSKRIVHQPGMMMIHGAWAVTRGTAEDHQKSAVLLEKMNGEQIDLFSSRTGMDKAELAKMIAAETWMGSQDCCDKGFADSLAEDSVKASAKATVESLVAARAPGAEARAVAAVDTRSPVQIQIGAAIDTAATTPNAHAVDATPEEVQRIVEARILALRASESIQLTEDEIAKIEKDRAIVLANQPVAKAARPAAPRLGGFQITLR